MPSSVATTAERGDLAADIATFVSEWVEPNAAAMAQGTGPRPEAVVAAAAVHGLAGLLVPRELGGRGLSHSDFARVIEAVARVCASTSVILDVHLSVATEPIVLFGDASQRERYLPRLARGEIVGAFALTEPASGSDAAALVTRAIGTGSSRTLTGNKAFITNAGSAGVYIVMTRTGEGSRGITAFLVDGGVAGLRAAEPLHKLGLRGSRTCELVLDEVAAPDEQRLGEEGQGFRVAMAALDSGRIGISAQAVGIAQGCLDLMVAQARRGDVDETALADVAARTAASRRLCHDAAAALDAGASVTRIASVAKLFATDTCMEAAHRAFEMCAPDSAAEEHPAAIRLRDAKACQIYEGTNQIQRIVIARELLRA